LSYTTPHHNAPTTPDAAVFGLKCVLCAPNGFAEAADFAFSPAISPSSRLRPFPRFTENLQPKTDYQKRGRAPSAKSRHEVRPPVRRCSKGLKKSQPFTLMVTGSASSNLSGVSARSLMSFFPV